MSQATKHILITLMYVKNGQGFEVEMFIEGKQPTRPSIVASELILFPLKGPKWNVL